MNHPRDVRERGFGATLALEDALALLAARIEPLPVEPVDLDDAAGRVLAEDVDSTIDVPAFPRACMDGWAVRAEDTFGASSYDPVTLAVVGTVLPGQVAAPIAAGQAARIMTGARIPDGADAVIPWEQASSAEERVRLVAAVPPGKHVARTGQEVARGQALLEAGRRLRAADVGLLASIGRGRALARRRPRVVVLASGDELLEPGAPALAAPAAGTFDATGPLLAACARERGLPVRRAPRAKDGRPAIEAALRSALADADLVITCGATSTGTEDVLPLVVADRGALWFHGVDMRPGHPVAFGLVEGRAVALLPGNPVAAWTCFHALVVPALRLLEGEPAARVLAPGRGRAGTLAQRVTSHAGRTDLVRVSLDASGSVTPLPGGSAAILSASRADGLVRVPRALEGLEAGTPVRVEDVGPWTS